MNNMLGVYVGIYFLLRVFFYSRTMPTKYIQFHLLHFIVFCMATANTITPFQFNRRINTHTHIHSERVDFKAFVLLFLLFMMLLYIYTQIALGPFK